MSGACCWRPAAASEVGKCRRATELSVTTVPRPRCCVKFGAFDSDAAVAAFALVAHLRRRPEGSAHALTHCDCAVGCRAGLARFGPPTNWHLVRMAVGPRLSVSVACHRSRHTQ